MTDQQMIVEYISEIAEKNAGYAPNFLGDPLPMQIAKLQDVWRKLQ